MVARSFFKNAVAVFAVMTVVLTGAMLASMVSPGQAHAAKSKRVSVYVVSSAVYKQGNNEDSVIKLKLSYNKDGFITKQTTRNWDFERITYKKKKVASHSFYLRGDAYGGFGFKYSYKRGKLVKSTGSDGEGLMTSKYTLNKKNLVTKVVTKWPNGGYVELPGTTVVATFKYDKEGRIVKSDYRYTDENQKIEDTLSYKYDSKGYPKSLTSSRYHSMWEEFGGSGVSKFVYNFKNTYKKGRLVKTVMRSHDEAPKTLKTITIKYKKIKVDARDVDAIKKQQKNYILYNFLTEPSSDVTAVDFIRNGYL